MPVATSLRFNIREKFLIIDYLKKNFDSNIGVHIPVRKTARDGKYLNLSSKEDVATVNDIEVC
jgi:hypothetical protein